MPKPKYDWNDLKGKFLNSDYKEIKRFFTDLGMPYNSEIRKRTKGWGKEKKELGEKALSKAVAKSITKQANALEIPMDQLTLAKKNAVVKVIQQMMNKDLNMPDLERTIKILRTEMGLPINYTKNENLNIEKVEGIHIIMGAKPVQSD